MLRFAVSILVFLATWGSLAHTAEFTYVQNDTQALPEFETSIYTTGPIVEGDAECLRPLVAKLRAAGRLFYQKAVCLLDSPGGALDPALALTKVVVDEGLTTYVGDGTKETSRKIHPRAILGFHAPFAFDRAQDIPVEVAQLLLKDAKRGGSSIAASKLVQGSGPYLLRGGIVQIETRLVLASFGAAGADHARMTFQIDDDIEGSYGGQIVDDAGQLEYGFTLVRNDFTFDRLMAGQQVIIKVNDCAHVIHLTSARGAITAMMNACI